tara:strand:- start:2257 stop:3477 length:1221 start_codon:yes stop_codon:yes gene_type:complete
VIGNLNLDKNIYSKLLKKDIHSMSKKFEKIFLDTKSDIKNSNKTLNVLDKKFKFNFKITDLKKFKKFKTIAIVGMGGSILGSEAIHGFLKDKIKKKIYFFNNLSEYKILNFKQKENLSNVLFIIISKSGNTVETLANTFILNVIRKNSKNIILISEKKNNSLFLLAKKFNLFHVEHKSHIGGRYSVLSEVGIIPAYLMGINIFELRSKITDYFKVSNKKFIKNNIIMIAKLIKTGKLNNLILLNYSPELEKFLYWYQQLIAESLGKKNKGFLPVISNVPKDHHSLLQLYLDGPKDKIFNIISLEKDSKKKIEVNKNTLLNNFLKNKKLSDIKNAQRRALIKAFKQKKIIFREIKVKTINEQVLGKLFSIFIFETVIIGKLLSLNPFNQPAVEKVKVYTKKYLLKNT